MTKIELIEKLIKAEECLGHDPECAHALADDLLLEYIGDQIVTDTYKKILRWYA